VSFKCPTCDSDAGIREAIYGLPRYPLDESKYFIAGCTTDGPEFVCVVCGWGQEETVSLSDSGSETPESQ